MKNFAKWTVQEVEDAFHLRLAEKHAVLEEWTSTLLPITEAEERRLRQLGEKLEEHVHAWNEEELKIKFIGFLLDLVGYDHAKYGAFFERKLSAKIGNERLAGVVDCVVAAGRWSPKCPYFCLHEYKPERHSSNDPRGQILAAMVAIQALNHDERPVYGAYIIGRQWFFVVLHQTQYAVSLAFDATKFPELRQIFMTLRAIRKIVENALQVTENA